MSLMIENTIFFAYLLGGRIWPQTRWANNIFIINNLLKFQDNEQLIHQKIYNFLHSQLSPNQLRTLNKVMQQDHKQYQVIVKNCITNQILKNEWTKTKIAVCNTIKAIQNNINPEFLIQNKSYAQKIIFDQQIFERKTNIRQDKIKQIQQTFNFAQLMIKQQKKLAYLFRKTYHQEELNRQQIRQVLNRRSKQNSYCTPSFQNYTKKQLREQILNQIFNKITKEIMIKYSIKVPWLIYDRRWVANINV